jgi:hypothetical protein
MFNTHSFSPTAGRSELQKTLTIRAISHTLSQQRKSREYIEGGGVGGWSAINAGMWREVMLLK